MTLLRRFAEHLAALGADRGRALVAVSGGIDSVVLLDLLVRSRDRHALDLVAAHVDHGIHPESAAVARQVEELARAAGVPFVAGRLALGPGASETRARAERYRWLRAERKRLGARWIFMAHQADDQQETVLMRFLRGSGPVGLAGMRGRDRGLVRPLLHVSRRAILGYATARRLSWWADPANQDPRHLRSWLRSVVVPALVERLPDLPSRLSDVSRHARHDRQGWDAALRGWPGLHFEPGRDAVPASVSWDVLSALPATLGAALGEALVRAARGPASPSRVRRALRALDAADSGATADLGRGWRLELGFGRLRVLRPSRSRLAPVALTGPKGQAVWGAWRLRWTAGRAPARKPRDGLTAWFIPGALSVRPLRPGDRIAPLAGRGRRLAVRCFQDARVPRSERTTWPILEGEGALAWIPGVCRSGLRLPEPGARALRVDVERRD